MTKAVASKAAVRIHLQHCEACQGPLTYQAKADPGPHRPPGPAERCLAHHMLPAVLSLQQAPPLKYWINASAGL